jgi:glycosyltransferase involved in cell wall biosynthesis
MMQIRRRQDRSAPVVGWIAFNMRPVEHPWGGGNWWLAQVVRHLRETGYDVRFDLDGPAEVVVVVDPRVGGNVTFGFEELARYKGQHPGTVCIHRVNECDLRKGTSEIDGLLAEVNRLADHTVFISAWLGDHHAEHWFDRSRPHSVIHNGADPAIFHPVGSAELGETMRLVTHHWSDNPLKGFDVYQEVDRLIAAGDLPNVELWVIGRWPSACEWRAARTFPPATGAELGDLLRQGHVYLTASRWEPGGMHHVEGAQCGLPVLYHEDGGGIVELASRYGIGYRDDVVTAIGDMRERYPELRRRALEQAPAGDVMCTAYRRLIQTLLVERPVKPSDALPAGLRSTRSG